MFCSERPDRPWDSAGTKDICFVQNVLTGPGTRPAFYPTGTGRSFPGVKQPGLQVNQLLRLVSASKRSCARVPLHAL